LAIASGPTMRIKCSIIFARLGEFIIGALAFCVTSHSFAGHLFYPVQRPLGFHLGHQGCYSGVSLLM
jgi:hypothetical protein